MGWGCYASSSEVVVNVGAGCNSSCDNDTRLSGSNWWEMLSYVGISNVTQRPDVMSAVAASGKHASIITLHIIQQQSTPSGRALPELFCLCYVINLKDGFMTWIKQLIDGCWPTTQIPNSFSSCHLQLKSLSCSVIILQRMRCNWALNAQACISAVCRPCLLWCSCYLSVLVQSVRSPWQRPTLCL